MAFFWVGLGGGLGSVLRYALSLGIKSPWGTLAANAIGSFLLAIIAVYFLDKPGQDNLRLALTTGFCGGFTTYSTFNLQVLNLLHKQEWAQAAQYFGVTLCVCLAFGALGYFIATKMFGA